MTERRAAGAATAEDRVRCSAPFRIRFDEAGPDGRLRTSALLRYAQDLAWMHSTREGFGRDWYAERGLAWLVRAAQIDVLGPMLVGDSLVGTTIVVGWRRVWARRTTTFVDAAGAMVASVDTDWVLLDAAGRPTRVPADFAVFGTTTTDLVLGRVALDAPPATGSHELAFEVRPQELDPMDHVNNAVYADWVEEAVIAAGDVPATRAVPRRLRLEYADAAAPFELLVASAWPDSGWSVVVRGASGGDMLRAHLD